MHLMSAMSSEKAKKDPPCKAIGYIRFFSTFNRANCDVKFILVDKFLGLMHVIIIVEVDVKCLQKEETNSAHVNESNALGVNQTATQMYCTQHCFLARDKIR